MSAMLAMPPYGGPMTVADLDAMDTTGDGRRYELIDGSLFVSPAPLHVHQIVLSELYTAVRAGVTADLRVLFAPVDVVLAEDTLLQPDLLVVRRSDLGGRRLAGPPLLVVEVLSPSTRGFDLLTKRERYERAGIASYWVVDPEPLRLVVWELTDSGTYQQVADVSGAQEVRVSQPFPVTLQPAAWV